MMEFIQKEIIEARVFRSGRDVEGLPQKIADTTYQHFLAFNIMRYEITEWAAEYAGKVLIYQNFDLIRNNACDFNNLIAAVNNPEKYLQSDKSHYNVPFMQLRRWFREVNNKEFDLLFDRRIFLQLEEGLKQNNGQIKQIRRYVTDWKITEPQDRKFAARMLYKMLYNSSYNDDMVTKFRALCKNRGWNT